MAFRLRGEIRGVARRQIERVLSGAVSDGSSVTLDLDQVEGCDEEAAKLLVSLTQRAQLAGGDLGLRSVPDRVLQVFDDADLRTKLHIVAATDDPSPSTQVASTFLFHAQEATPFAYASSRHDYSLIADDRLWAHRSHNWLLEAGTGAALAYRIGNIYYHADTGERAYTEQTAPENRKRTLSSTRR